MSEKSAERKLMIFPTSDCQLACSYCYARGGETQIDLGFETVKPVIDFFLEKEQGRAIKFHGGGEPTMNMRLVKKVVEYARSKDDFTFNVTSNGIWSSDTTQFILKNIDRVVISLDGPQDINDLQRPFRGGAGSYRKVAETIKKLRASGSNFSTRSTISQHSVKRMPEIVEHAGSLGIKVAGLEPLYVAGRCKTSGISGPNLNEFAERYIAAMKVGKEIGVKVYTQMFTPNAHKRSFCGACGKNPDIGITPDGFISSCSEVTKLGDEGCNEFFYGKVEDGKVIFYDEKLENLGRRIPENMEGCSSCESSYQCAGQCPLKALKRSGTMFAPIKEYCEATKKLLGNGL